MCMIYPPTNPHCEESLDVVATEAIAWAESGGDSSAVRSAFESYFQDRAADSLKPRSMTQMLDDRHQCSDEILSETARHLSVLQQKNVRLILYRFANERPVNTPNQRRARMRMCRA